MNQLSTTVKSIRKRLGQGQVEFAKTLGVRQATISVYESGKTTPGVFTLLRLYKLANPAEKRALEEALGVLGEAIKQGSIRPISGPGFTGFTFGGRRVITEAQQKAIHEAKQPLDEILALWAQYSADKHAVEFFREAATYLRVRLSGLK
jgi:transcriptional regulator with XRE-family HTH domain